MKYSKYDRQEIKQLHGRALNLFTILESEEKGEFSGSGVPGLCMALAGEPRLVAFSCLVGNGKSQKLSTDLGVLFTTSLRKKAKLFMEKMKNAGYTRELLVIVDDCEPITVWGWSLTQVDVTTWYRMAIEDSDTPSCFEVRLWSEIREGTDRIVRWDMVKAPDSLLLHRLCKHMRQFPNKKLRCDVMIAAKMRAAHYAYQGITLSLCIPHAILLQTETPWNVKDPLYAAGVFQIVSGQTQVGFPIIHPFSEERR